MPIEIKELLIKAVVSDTTRQQTSQVSPADISKVNKDIVKECVQEVLQKLKEKTER